MTGQDKGPAVGKTSATAKAFWRMLAAICWGTAALQGAQASTYPESSPLTFDFAATMHSAEVLPDGTVIIYIPLSTNTAMGVARFSNLARNPLLRIMASTGNADPGLEAFAGSDVRFVPPFDQEIFTRVSPTVSTDEPDGIFPGRLKLEEGPIYLKFGDKAPRPRLSDSGILILTGLGFALACTVGRRPSRDLRRFHPMGSCR